MILSKDALTTVANAAKMNWKCQYMHIGKWIVNYVLNCRGARKTANTHGFVILVG